MPPATLDAFRDHGRPRASLAEDLDSARDTMAALAESGISLKDVTDQLLAEGVDLFSAAFGKLLKAVDRQTQGCRRGPDQPPHLCACRHRCRRRSARHSCEWAAERKSRRLWARDASLWTGTGRRAVARLARRDAGSAGRRPAAHANRGGGQERRLHRRPAARHGRIEPVSGGPQGDVRQGRRLSRAARPRFDRSRAGEDVRAHRRSGSHAVHRVEQVGLDARAEHLQGVFLRSAGAACRRASRRAGHFVAITDPGSTLQQVGRTRRLPRGSSSAGRRSAGATRRSPISAWSRRRIMGVDIAKFLDRTEEMVMRLHAVGAGRREPGRRPRRHPGRRGQPVRPRQGHASSTSPGIVSLGAWLEQLMAESTGKEGKGLIPIDREALAAPDAYGLDRIFVYLRLKSAPDAAQDAWADALERAGHPVVRIVLDDAVRPRRGILPVGVRDRGRRVDSRRPPLRSAGRRGQQDRDAQADRRLRAKRRAAGRDADLHQQGHRSVHRRHQRRHPGEGRTR